jgi:xanthine dehydrogenase accessory factor
MVLSKLVVIRGGGDLGSGCAHRLHRAGFAVAIIELAQPLVIRRAVAFASAVYEGQRELEGVTARLARNPREAMVLLEQGTIPVMIDPDGANVAAIGPVSPLVIVDARMAKRNLGTGLSDAPIVVGLGPGFTAGQDVHAVVETMRGHSLGRVILQGTATADTHVPGLVQGHGRERVVWAPCSGTFHELARIGERVEAGQSVAEVNGQPVRVSIAGVLRGLLHEALDVRKGQKVGDVDPRGVIEHCFTISDKARAIAGGALEAILYLDQHLTTDRS